MLLGSAYGKVTLDANGVVTGVTTAVHSLESLQRAGEIAGRTLSAVGNGLTIGLTLPILAMGAASIKLASDLEETKTKTKEIFGGMTDDILAWADTANTSLGQTRQQALDAADTFALFGKVAGKSGDDLNAFAKQNVQFAADFASFYNTSPEDAITAIGAAYRGESEPIRRFNILLNDQIIKAKAVAMEIYDGNGALSMQTRILAVNAIIAEQGSAAMGDFARTSGGLANQTRIMNAQFKDSLVMLGQNLLPIAVQVVKALNAMLSAFQKMPAPVQQGLLVFLGFLAVLGPVLSGLGTLVTLITGITTIWPTITAGATALGVALPGLGVALPSLGAAFTGLAGTIGSTGAAIVGLLAPIAVVLPAVGLLVWAWNADFLGFQTNLRNMSQQIPVILAYAWEQAKIAMREKTHEALVDLANWGQSIQDWFNSVDWAALGSNIITGIINGIMSTATQLYEALRSLAEAALAAAKSALGISSPSRKFAYLGQMSGLGYMQAFQQAVNPADMAQALARPAQNTSTNQTYSQVQNFGGGVSIREARRMQAEQEKRFNRQMDYAFGG